MDTPDLPVELMLKRVVSAVRKASNGGQEPWMEGFIEGDFFFRATPTSGPIPTVHDIYEIEVSGNVAEARRMINVVLASRPNSAVAHFVSGEIYLKDRRYAEAQRELDDATRLDPSLSFAKGEAITSFKDALKEAGAKRK